MKTIASIMIIIAQFADTFLVRMTTVLLSTYYGMNLKLYVNLVLI